MASEFTRRATSVRLIGRDFEQRTVVDLLGCAGSHGSGALLVLAHPGTGKSALLQYAVECAGNCVPGDSARKAGAGPESGTRHRVLRLRGTAAEAQVPFSGLHGLLQPLLRRARAHSAALERALRLDGAGEPAGTAVLPALSELLVSVAREGPLLVCVDDLHLVDRESRAALEFAARRVQGPLTVLMAADEDRAERLGLPGIPVMRLGGLEDADAAGLLRELAGGETCPGVRDVLLGAVHGNPGLLTELVAALSPDELSGRVPLPRPLPLEGAVLRADAERVRRLPADTRLLLLLLAAEEEVAGGEGGATETGGLLEAAKAAGLDPACLEPAEAAGVVRPAGGRIRFGHPLLGAAVYLAEPLSRRRAAHELLARTGTGTSAGGRDGRALRRLGHLAACATAPDDALADALERAAACPVAPGGPSRSDRARALSRAAELTGPAPHTDGAEGEGKGAEEAEGAEGAEAAAQERRALRWAAAARHAFLGGSPAVAGGLLARAAACAATDTARAGVEFVRGMVGLQAGSPEDARADLLSAAARAARNGQGGQGGQDGRAERGGREGDATAPEAYAQEAYALAAQADWVRGDLDGLLRTMRRIGASAGLPGSAAAGFAAGAAAALSGDFGSAARLLRRSAAGAEASHDPRELLCAGVAAWALGETRAAHALYRRALEPARASASAALLPSVLARLAEAELRLGRPARARSFAREGLREAERGGQENCAAHHHALLVMAAAMEGDDGACAAHAEAAFGVGRDRGLGLVCALADWGLALADLSRNHPDAALARLEAVARARPGAGHPVVSMLSAPLLVEARALAGVATDPDHPALAGFARWTRAARDPHALARLARCRALLAPPEEADGLFSRALAVHGTALSDFERARTELLHGRTLRRHRRPGAARGHLRAALASFEGCGAAAWADQAREELRATGAPDAAEPAGHALLAERLTPQQLRIALCVAEGCTNREVAARLFLSPRTVDHHLRNIFSALGVRSRTALARAVTAGAGDGPAERASGRAQAPVQIHGQIHGQAHGKRL
ncbi:AAA family ATPase [Streptomyces sp. NPDC059637]|uniref:helix-turn-helix transcriptional regulator n=1 Tax=Streptomyces sp. NPDC059637 TaxID=3347752 RepID=UPI0036832ECF